SGGARAVVEYMAEVAVATGAADRGARHPEQVIGAFDHVAPGDRLPVAGPAGAGIEFGGGVVQCRGAGHAAEQAGHGWSFVIAAESPLGTVAAHDVEGRQRKELPPLCI